MLARGWSDYYDTPDAMQCPDHCHHPLRQPLGTWMDGGPWLASRVGGLEGAGCRMLCATETIRSRCGGYYIRLGRTLHSLDHGVSNQCRRTLPYGQIRASERTWVIDFCFLLSAPPSLLPSILITTSALLLVLARNVISAGPLHSLV